MASQPSTGSEAVTATSRKRGGGPLASKEELLDLAKSASFAFVCVKLALPVLKFAGRKLFGIAGEPQKAGDGPSRGEAAVRQTSIAMPQESEDRWHIVNAPPPAMPDGYKPVASGTFPCSVQDFYSHLFSSSGSPFFIETHRAVGKQWDFVMGGWRAASPDGNGMSPEDKSLLGAQTVFKYIFGEAAPGGFTRLFTFVNPKKPPSPCDTRTVQRQQFCVYEGGVLVFAHAMNMLDIPFKESFTVNIVWVVRPAADGSAQCDATVYLKVHFVKRTLVAGIINATTFKENALFYKEFFAAVAAHVASNPPLPTAASLRTASAAASSANRRASLSQPGGPGRAPSLIAGQGAEGGNAAAAVPFWKQLRAVLVLLVLVGSLVHQLLLAVQLRRVIAAAGLGSPGGQHAPLLLPWP